MLGEQLKEAGKNSQVDSEILALFLFLSWLGEYMDIYFTIKLHNLSMPYILFVY